MSIDMKKALRQAALLRNRIESCLQAASSPMTGRELAEYAGVVDVIGTSLTAYQKMSTQLANMVKRGLLERIGQGQTTTYRWLGHPEVAVHKPEPKVADLQIKVNKANHTIGFVFQGLHITIEVQ